MNTQRDMPVKYNHTQRTIWPWLIFGLVAVTWGVLAILAGWTVALPFLLLILVFGGLGIVFSSLTIEIRDGALRSHFGAKVPAKTVELCDIQSVEVVTNRWIHGWGVRYTSKGSIYNIAGYDAVEIRLKTGGQFRLGTDEPERLREAILEATGIGGGILDASEIQQLVGGNT